MKHWTSVGLLLCALLPAAFALGDTNSYDGLFQAGQSHQSAGRHAEAREAYEKALAVQAITPEQTAQAWLAIAAGHMAANQWQPANTALEKILALEGVSPATRVQAHLSVARIFSNYGGEWGWGKVKTACAAVLETPDADAESKLSAQKSLVKAWMGLRQYTDARRVMAEVVSRDSIPAAERAAMQILSAKAALLLPDFDAARADLAKAQDMEGISDGDRADIQLQLALSYYAQGDYEKAKPELLKVPAMPGSGARRTAPGRDNAYTPAHEARLRLRLRKLTGADEAPALTVLFIGSSMTMRGDMPHLLASLAASAPSDRPRIMPAIFGRGGTRIDTFWNDGDAPGTARHLIATEPWDAVVIETFYTLKPAELLQYGTNFVNLVRRYHAKPVLYTSPAAQGHPYPDAHRAYQDAVTNLARTLSVPVAPAVGAYLEFLGTNPAPDRLGIVYNDWIHATGKGNYLIACSLYAALTGFSPVGLAHPDLDEAEARAFQEAAWHSYQAANDATKPGPQE